VWEVLWRHRASPTAIIVIAEVKDMGRDRVDRHVLGGCDVVDVQHAQRCIKRAIGARVADNRKLHAAGLRREPAQMADNASKRKLVESIRRSGSRIFLPSRAPREGRGITTRQYARLVSEWIATIGLDPHLFGTHSLRRTKAILIYRHAPPAPFAPGSASSRSIFDHFDQIDLISTGWQA
jgi:hypothetical protein